MAICNDDHIEWSSEAFSILTVVNDKLPTIVKVADGYYSENEAESFSNGDLIKLDFKRHYTKVKARPVGTDLLEGEDESNVGSEILIPLGYCGKLYVHCLKDTFHSMKELIIHFPRFIKVGKAFNAHKGKRWTIPVRIHAGDELELDREIPDMGIVCRINQTKILVPNDAEVMCHLLPDKTQYTIREVVETFKMPQYVRFIDSELERFMTENLNEAIDNITHFDGYFKITGIFRQEVVVGHHKPAGVLPSTTGLSSQRSIAILPLDSEVVQNLEVYIPIYDDFVDYELMMIRNFSTNVNMDVVEGSLYLEFQKKPRVHLLPSNELPPPRPPPPNTNRRKAPAVPRTQHDVPKIKEGTKPNRSPGQVKKKPPPLKGNDSDEDDEPESAYEEIPDFQEIEEYSKKTGLDFSKFPKTFRVGLKKVHNELKKLGRSHSVEIKAPPSSQDLRVPPSIKDLNPQDDDDSDEESLAYDYPDLTKLASMPRPPPVSDTPRYQASLKVTKPVGKIQPISRDENPTKKFSDMTTEEVVGLFKTTKLPSLASVCEKEGLDGSFFSSLSETELKNAFKLSDLQFIKVNKIINEGWRPHIN